MNTELNKGFHNNIWT